MSIQSTVSISRTTAIMRIEAICNMVANAEYRQLRSDSFEPEYDVADFVSHGLDFDVRYVEKWTNKMLEDTMDKPFFRRSMFDSYIVLDEVGQDDR